jgi:hypothetical protein
MDGYYDRVETQLRALTERGAHRRPRVRATPMVAIAVGAAVAVVVVGVFLGVRGRGHSSPASSAPACAPADWRMTGIPAQQLDGATVAGVAVSSTTSCHLRLAISFDLVNRSGALAGAVGANVDTTVVPGSPVDRRWAWRNLCSSIGFRPAWFRLMGGQRTVRVPVSPPPCVDRHDTTGFGLFELSSPDVLSGRGIATARLGTRLVPTLVAVSDLLGVFGDRIPGRGCGVDRGEHMLDHNDLFFGHGRFVGYEYSGRFLATTAGLRVGDTIARARQLYGAAFNTSAAQGGSWSAAGLRGYLTAPQNGRIATIDAGNVGCPALSP